MKSLQLAALLLGGSAVAAVQPLAAQDTATTAPTARPWMNTVLSPDKRADLILAQMTLDEKVTMLHGLAGMSFGPGEKPAGAVGAAGGGPGGGRRGGPARRGGGAGRGGAN